MPKDKGGIGRTGNKHRKPQLYDKHRKLKQPKQPQRPDVQDAAGDGVERPWQFELAIVRGIRRCDGDWQRALLELQQRDIVNELTDVPELYEIVSNMPNGHEILKDLGELEAHAQDGMPLCLCPRAVNPLVHIPPSPNPPKRSKRALPFHQRPRKRGGLMRDVEAGIIPLPRPMRPIAR